MTPATPRRIPDEDRNAGPRRSRPAACPASPLRYSSTSRTWTRSSRAVQPGATLKRPAQDQFYGDRDGCIAAPFRHGWTAALHVEDVTPDRPRLDYESHGTALDRNELGALLVAAGTRPARRARLVSLLALNGLRVSEATGADIEHLGLERGHRTQVTLLLGSPERREAPAATS